MTDALIEVKDLWVRYGSGEAADEALRGVDLEIGRGEFVAIVGPSGSGKSSLLHVLGLMLRPTRAARLMLDGEDLLTAGEARRTSIRKAKIGFVFQRLNLVPVLSATDNVQLALWLRGQPLDGAADELLERLGIGSIKRKRPAQMSVGQQQRVAVARAIAGSPKLLLADEPTGSLDSCNARMVLDLLRQVHAQQRELTAVIVTHNEEVAGAADRIIHIHDGRIAHAGGHSNGG
jgi:ABC-type lipoprotein export system ATPase subunit